MGISRRGLFSAVVTLSLVWAALLTSGHLRISPTVEEVDKLVTNSQLVIPLERHAALGLDKEGNRNQEMMDKIQEELNLLVSAQHEHQRQLEEQNKRIASLMDENTSLTKKVQSINVESKAASDLASKALKELSSKTFELEKERKVVASLREEMEKKVVVNAVTTVAKTASSVEEKRPLQTKTVTQKEVSKEAPITATEKTKVEEEMQKSGKSLRTNSDGNSNSVSKKKPGQSIKKDDPEENTKMIYAEMRALQRTNVTQGVDVRPSSDINRRNILSRNRIRKLAAQTGKLYCNGQPVDSEVVYWKEVPGDREYESPITPHHGVHHDRYLTFEYDIGGWNNIRMGVESVIVLAHAMGRTLVIPPPEHLYLLNKEHKDAEDEEAHDEMGFADFFDVNLLRSHYGFHVITTEEFLKREAYSGGLHEKIPEAPIEDMWGPKLRDYLNIIADAKPTWLGSYVVFPDRPDDYNFTNVVYSPDVLERIRQFSGDRHPTYYDEELQKAHHIHLPAHGPHRLLQHHYAFAFFADPEQQSFYRRFVRDYMRYKDEVQCAGADLVSMVRATSRSMFPEQNGDYYALHIRRGDFQYKDVKISAAEIVQNLHYPNGTAIIPRGSLVYLSTDDPDGVCKDCTAQGLPCDMFPYNKPIGCPNDTSWKAFNEAGWTVVMLRDYLKAGRLGYANPNYFGMVESIVCSRAKHFAGTYFSTFTGYIHRLRGYHGLGEESFYINTGHVLELQIERSVGHGFTREWRAGWTDDEGDLI